jgi:hypothetical protein
MTLVSAAGLVVSFVLGGFLGRRVYKELNATRPEPEELPPVPLPQREVPVPRKDGLPSPS